MYCASKVPANNAQNCDDVYKLGKYLVDKSNQNAYTDLQCAINLSHVGKKGCLMNIDVNLPLIKNELQVEELKKIIASLK